jgi:hypothetical protein
MLRWLHSFKSSGPNTDSIAINWVHVNVGWAYAAEKYHEDGRAGSSVPKYETTQTNYLNPVRLLMEPGWTYASVVFPLVRTLIVRIVDNCNAEW